LEIATKRDYGLNVMFGCSSSIFCHFNISGDESC
jgi:hypothetical protein